MRVRPRDILLALAVGLTLLAGLALLTGFFFGSGNALGQGKSARPTVAELRKQVGALARSGKFDAAEKAVDAYLRHDAANVTALLMQAELALDRPDPKPELALELVRQVGSADRQLAAQARLDLGKAYFRLTRYDDAE